MRRVIAVLVSLFVAAFGLVAPAAADGPVVDPATLEVSQDDGWIASSIVGDGLAEASGPVAVAQDWPVGALSGGSVTGQALTTEQFEMQVTDLINAERTSRGLRPLRASLAIMIVARNWSTYLLNSGQFYHNPNYFGQMPQTDLWGGGENIMRAWGSTASITPKDVNNGFMGSPGHRSNMLDPDWTHVGVGVVTGTRPCPTANGLANCAFLYVTENFAAYENSGPTDSPWWTPATPVTPFESVLLAPDMTSDGRGEVMAIDATGQLVLYPFTAGATLGSPGLSGTGFAGQRVFAPGDWTGDGFPDIAAITAGGDLYRYTANLGGRLNPSPTKIGNGWQTFQAIPAADLNGDKRPDLLGIDANGDLYLYAWLGDHFTTKKKVGWGWTGWQLYSGGDLNKDGRTDILGINPAGFMYCYHGNGNGTFQTKKLCGNGWNTFQLAAGADLNGDAWADIVGLDTVSRKLYYYRGYGSGTFGSKQQIGNGW
ncbi:MAG: FG-GAP-like repeat-containing protein [Bifidobacteriaceae bacterium]|jgi:hypothetical protein|nr:FG-GAP-like repeat-containing protein [Bifidobacteriaceae bacterium]